MSQDHFVQFSHGILAHSSDMSKHVAVEVPSFNPTPDQLPVELQGSGQPGGASDVGDSAPEGAAESSDATSAPEGAASATEVPPVAPEDHAE